MYNLYIALYKEIGTRYTIEDIFSIFKMIQLKNKAKQIFQRLAAFLVHKLNEYMFDNVLMEGIRRLKD